jgi:Ca-activated chloride channel family protein
VDKVFMKKSVLISISFVMLPLFLFAQAGRKKVLEGNQLYSEEKYDAASNKYQDALLENPSSPLIQFNVGDVLYKKNNYEKSLEAYQKSLDTDDPMMQSQAYYNLGNALYRSQKLPESILAYEQALKLNPDDEDAKFNLEFVRNKMKENAQPQSQDQQQQQQQNQQNQQKQDQNKKDQDKKEQEKQQEQQKQQEQAQQQEQKKEMSKKEAEQLLEALKENQEEMKKKQAQASGRMRVEKDW